VVELLHIIFGLGIIDKDMNHELKILNQIRNVFAHEIDPLGSKVPKLIKKFKFYPKNKINKTGNLIVDSMVDGNIAGMIDGFLTRYLAEFLWEIPSKDKTPPNSNFT